MSVSSEIDSKWNEYIAKNNATIAEFLEQIENDRKAKRAWMDSLQRKIEEYLVEGHSGTCGRYNSGSYSSVYIDIPIKVSDKDETIVLEPYMMNSFSEKEHEKSTVLYLPVWCRTNKKTFDYQKLLDKMGSKYKNKPIKTSPSSGWGNWYIVKEYDLTQELKFDEVVKDIQDVISIIEEVYH